MAREAGLETSALVWASMDERKKDSRWWWMRRYRDWEANRKEFIYPENFIEPELRDDKAHSFDEFEGTLSQDEPKPE